MVINILIFNCLSLNFSMLLFWSYLTQRPIQRQWQVQDVSDGERPILILERKLIITASKRSLRRLRFHTCLSVHGKCVWQTLPPRADTHPGRHPPWADTPWADTPRADTPWGRLSPGQTMTGYTPPLHAGIWSTSGQYESHWKVFFFGMIFAKNCIKMKAIWPGGLPSAPLDMPLRYEIS